MLTAIQAILGDDYEAFTEDKFDMLHDLINSYRLVNYKPCKPEDKELMKAIREAFEVQREL